MRGIDTHNCGCFPTGHHYPGIIDQMDRTAYAVQELARCVTPDSRWIDAPLCVIDFETTGRDSETDRIIEIGLVYFDNGRCTQRHEWLINPGIPVPEESRAVHGITDDELKDAPAFCDVFDRIASILTDRIPVAYNAPFDRGFLHAEMRRVTQATPSEVPAFQNDVVWIDPLIWARELFKYEKGKKLTDMCQRLNIKIDKAHRACGDAEAAGNVLLAMAPKLPERYDDLVRLQSQYGSRQEAEFAAWRSRMRNS